MTDLVVLWDIDGTLLSVHGAGRRAFAVALAATWQRPFDLDGVSFAGATDLGVLAQVLGSDDRDATHLRDGRQHGVGVEAAGFQAARRAGGHR
ncbi:MAG: hypothetical protein IT382_02955, partial [Deltaproteobacteria bacterium]|nr:hypothetical protein [Deltaproteobacteria bacterium]